MIAPRVCYGSLRWDIRGYGHIVKQDSCHPHPLNSQVCDRGTKSCAARHLDDHCHRCSGMPGVVEVVAETALTAFRLGGYDAIEAIGISPTHCSSMDIAYLLGEIPQRFRLTDGSADGFELTSGGWQRVFFPPLDWLKVDLSKITAGPKER